MTTHSARIEDSLQIALSKLRRIETTRVAAAQEANQSAHLAPEASVQERRIDLERQRRELERLQLQSLGTPRRMRALLAAVIAGVVIAGGLFWYQQHQSEARYHRGAAALDQSEGEPEPLQNEFEQAELALEAAQRRAERLRAQISERERKSRAQEETPGRARRAERRRGRRAEAAQPEGRQIVLRRECKDDPLACAR